MKKNYIFFLFCIILFNTVFSQAPVINPIAGSTVVCSAPSPAQTFSASASNSPISYSWSVAPSTSVIIANVSGSVTSIDFPDLNISYTVYCSATNASGTSSTESLAVTVYGTPEVTFSGGTSFCQGSSTNLQASATVLSASPTNLSASSTLFSWYPSTGLNTSSGPDVIANPSVTTTYTVISLLGTCFNTNTITIYTNPSVTISGANYFCQGSSATLAASPSSTFGFLVYSWLPATGLNTMGGPVVTANPPVNTTYSVTLTSGACSSMDTITVHTNPTLVAPLSTTICQGTSANLLAGATFTDPALSYSWSPPTGLNTTISPGVIANPTTSIIYTITLNSGACSSEGTVAVTANTVSPVAIAGATSFCQGSSVALSASPGNSIAAYSWLPSAGLNTNSSASVIASPTTSTTYTVILTEGMCSSAASITLTTNPLVSVTGPAGFCQGSSAALIASPLGTAAGFLSYSWLPATGLNTTSSASVIANPTTSTTYTVLLTDGTCTSTGVITLTTNPEVSVSGPAAFCQGSTAVLSASPSYTTAAALSYNWAPSTGLNTSSAVTVVASPSVSITYTVSLMTGGCISTNTISLSTNPYLVFSGETTFCEGLSTTLTASPSSTPATSLSYSWIPSTGLNITNGPVVIANPTLSTTYTVELISGTCVNTGTITITSSDCRTGIKTNTPGGEAGFIIYPNPNNGTFFIKTNQKQTLTLVNELGQTIKTLVAMAGEETQISDLAEGIYFIVTPAFSKKISVVNKQ